MSPLNNDSVKSGFLKVKGLISDYWMAGIIIVLGIVVGSLLLSGWWDNRQRDKFHQQREEALKKASYYESLARLYLARAERAEEQETILENKNTVLKKAFEDQAKLLNEQDAKTKAEAAKITKMRVDFEEKLDEIEMTRDEDQKCLACKDAREIGISFSFCTDCVE